MKKPIKKNIEKKRRKITLEELAIMTQNGFMEMNEKFSGQFESIDKRFESIDKRFESIDKRFDDMDKRFDIIENKLSSLERRIMFLEDKITEHSQELRKLRDLIEKYYTEKEMDREKILWLEKRVEKLEEKAGLKHQV